MSGKAGKAGKASRNPIMDPSVSYPQALAFTQGQLAAGATVKQLKSEYTPALLVNAIKAYQAGFNQTLNEMEQALGASGRKLKR